MFDSIEEIQKWLESEQKTNRANLLTVRQVIETVGVFKLFVGLRHHWRVEVGAEKLQKFSIQRSSAVYTGQYLRAYRSRYGRSIICDWLTINESGEPSILRLGAPSADRPQWIVLGRSIEKKPSNITQYRVGHITPVWSSKAKHLRWSWFGSLFDPGKNLSGIDLSGPIL